MENKHKQAFILKKTWQGMVNIALDFATFILILGVVIQ